MRKGVGTLRCLLCLLPIHLCLYLSYYIHPYAPAVTIHPYVCSSLSKLGWRACSAPLCTQATTPSHPATLGMHACAPRNRVPLWQDERDVCGFGRLWSASLGSGGTLAVSDFSQAGPGWRPDVCELPYDDRSVAGRPAGITRRSRPNDWSPAGTAGVL